jgi:DNA-binding transcriptional MerR regulator
MKATPFYWEIADVARALRVVPETVRAYAATGRLPVAAQTPRGLRLFTPQQVETFRRRRDVRKARMKRAATAEKR